MRRILLAAALAAAATPAAAQRKVVKAFGVAPDVGLRIHNLVGSTKVTGWDRDSILVIAAIPAGGGTFFGGGSGRFAKLGIEGQDPSLTGPGTELEVKVPRNARVWVKSGSASVEVTGLAGEIEVSTVTAAIRIEGAPRVASLESIDGDLTMIGAATVVRARTGAGIIRIQGARTDIVATTIQGTISLESDRLQAARLETVSGKVTVAAGLEPDGALEVQAHDGDVTLSLPGDVDARFDLATVKGTIGLALPGVTPVPAGGRAARFSTGRKAGAGRGGSVTVRTFSGKVIVDSNRSGRPGV